jgi:hypothetical protein
MDRHPNIAQARIYAESLEFLDSASLIKAFGRAEEELDHVPAIRELIALAQDNDALMEGEWAWLHKTVAYPGISATLENWGKSSHGESWSRMEHVLVALGGSKRGGLTRISETEPANLGYLRKDFERAWKSFRA